MLKGKKGFLIALLLVVLGSMIGQVAVAQDAPVQGGTLVIAVPNDFDTLDIHKSADGNAMSAAWLMGATLVFRDVDASYKPWLAESWETSEDGLVWTFHLRQDVKFHDGTPLTANDFAWTIARLLDPETGAGQAGRMRAVASAVALDDYTLQLTLGSPYPILLEQLSNTGVVQPYSQAFVEAQGDNFGRTFMGVGPYKFVEWQTGEKVVLERNPDFAWGMPLGDNQGPYYIDRIEFRFIPETATIVAGLEAGEIDYALVNKTDADYLESTGQVNILRSFAEGMLTALHMNLGAAPFDNLQVRQAFNYAVDKETLINVMLLGDGTPQYGPLSPGIAGYWDGIEEVGYHYDLERAKALMEEAGYSYDADGKLSKDGAPFTVTLKCESTSTQLCEVLQAQYQNLGVDLQLEIIDPGGAFGLALADDFQLLTMGYSASESDILYRWFHTSRDGALNLERSPGDPALDEILNNTRNDAANRDPWVQDAQRYLVENAFVVPLYLTPEFTALSTRVQGAIPNPRGLSAVLKAYINNAWLAS
jgi:peptide/nickel transport system substrate-binding protein